MPNENPYIDQQSLFTQSVEALTHEYFSLRENFNDSEAREIFLRVMLNSLVDRRFSSEEYQDLQNDRLRNLASIMVILMSAFVGDPQSFVDDEEYIEAYYPTTAKRILALVYDNVTQALGQEIQTVRKDI
jgi:hypothetical protein